MTCICGHSADWHAKGGVGDCDHDAECNCRKYTTAMIGYDDLRGMTDRAASIYPPQDLALARAWWAERGVDYAGLVRFCMEDGIDSAANVLPAVIEAAATPEQLLAGGFAMSTEIGFLLGWLASEKARA